MSSRRLPIVVLMTMTAISTAPAMAQEETEAPRRTRIALGPQLVPSYPGADTVSIRPLIDVARRRGNVPFAFEAPDESFGPGLIRGSGLEIGPALGFEGKRSRADTDGRLAKVGFTVEVGGFVNYQIIPAVRLRTEVRKGVGGHRGWIGTVGADYVARDADAWLFSVGPRVTLSDRRYNRAYFGISAADAITAGLPAYDPGGGLQAVGGTAGLTRQFTRRWGIYAYAKFDRLVADPGKSPVLRAFGTRNQLAGGIAATYTFGRGLP